MLFKLKIQLPPTKTLFVYLFSILQFLQHLRYALGYAAFPGRRAAPCWLTHSVQLLILWAVRVKRLSNFFRLVVVLGRSSLGNPALPNFWFWELFV